VNDLQFVSRGQCTEEAGEVRSKSRKSRVAVVTLSTEVSANEFEEGEG
jgi:hypothetical protein